jgi:hypothetical protein
MWPCIGRYLGRIHFFLCPAQRRLSQIVILKVSIDHTLVDTMNVIT